MNNNKSILKKHDKKKNKLEARSATFDEMNVLATYHPIEKDYGMIKITEPKTPFNYINSDDPSSTKLLDSDDLANRLRRYSDKPSTVSSSSSFTEEAKKRREEFENARKQHYNMKEQMKKAKELLRQEENDD